MTLDRRNPYVILGIPADASDRDIRRAHDRKLAGLRLGLDPDAHDPAARGTTPLGEADIRWAWEQLSDPEARVYWSRLLEWAELLPRLIAPALPIPAAFQRWCGSHQAAREAERKLAIERVVGALQRRPGLLALLWAEHASGEQR